MRCRALPVLIVVVAAAAGARAAAAPPTEAYDPLAVAKTRAARTIDLDVTDAARQRAIPIRVYLPDATTATPVILFSHGLGGSRQGNAFLGRHWAARGYVAVFLQHPGSDDSVWRNLPARGRMAAMRDAASAENLLARVRDVHAVLDQLEKWNVAEGHALAGRLDMEHVGMSGHSFGAVTTQAVSGQSYRAPTARGFTDARIDAAIAFSPSTPRGGGGGGGAGAGGDLKAAIAAVKIPWLLMTGTHDAAPIGGQTVESRLAVYPNQPDAIDKYELVLNEAEHSAFTDRALPGDRRPRNPNHHRAILALSTAFWDAYLRRDAAARKWLDGSGPRSVLQPRDEWQLK